jgi:hypothetical protein
MSGKRSRDKGAGWERELAKILREAGFAEAKRGFQSRSGSDAPDVVLSDFWVEAKVGARTNPKKALEQATDAERDYDDTSRIPVAVTRDDRKKAMVTMWLTDWIKLGLKWRT